MAEHVGNGCEFREVKGDLFKCDKDFSLAHCVSADMHMGKGIATVFKKMFGGIDELRRQGGKQGGVSILKRDERFIYYLITKEKYFYKPTYETLRKSLEAMARHCQENNVRKLAMPRIGCGLDQLDWIIVRNIVKEIFKDINVNIVIYSL